MLPSVRLTPSFLCRRSSGTQHFLPWIAPLLEGKLFRSGTMTDIFLLPTAPHAAPGTHRHREGCLLDSVYMRMRERSPAQIISGLSGADDRCNGGAINTTRRLLTSVSDLVSVS